MRGKKARAIRSKYGVKHARLARPRIVSERGAPFGSKLMALSPKHLRSLFRNGDETGPTPQIGRTVPGRKRHSPSSPDFPPAKSGKRGKKGAA